MAEKTGIQTSWIGGISDSSKAGGENTYVFGRNTNHRNDPKKLTINPSAENDTGTLISGLPMCATRACDRLFFYDNSGNIYIKESDAYTKAHTAPDSVGNGIAYFPEDSNLYYASNTTLGRLFEACTGNDWVDDFLSAEGGTPTNTKSISLNGTTQYLQRADTASLSITDDISLETYYKPSALPTTGVEQVLMSKWDENSDERSYRMYITTSSNFFGDGSDGALTISTNTTDAPIDSACSGTAGAYALTATNASFAANQKILIHQTRGTNAGTYEINTIASYTAGTITTEEPLDISYNSTGSNKAQVLVLKQYTNVTVNSGITLTAKAWNGTVGGILAFFANGTVTITGTITATGKGFRGGVGFNGTDGTKDLFPQEWGYYGEGTSGPSGKGTGVTNNGNGAGASGNGYDGAHQDGGSGGSNGGYGYPGTTYGGDAGAVGSLSGSSNLSTISLGGGGAGGAIRNQLYVGDGATGGGIICIFGGTITVSGSIVANGNDSYYYGYYVDGSGGGAGAGGSILLKAQTATLGSSLITCNGGNADPYSRWNKEGGNGGSGRVALYYSSSYTGTTTPTATITVDSSLATVDGYVLKLQVSTNGTAYDTFSWDITDYLTTNNWRRWQISWDAATSTANAYVGGVHLGTKTGTLTAIYNSTAKFAIGADFDSSGNPQNLAPGLFDDSRVWNDVRTETEFRTYNDQILTGNEYNLIAYYKCDSGVTDSQVSGLNNLTAEGSPTYSSDIPFYGLTTRNDQDQSNSAGTGSTTALATSISEGATAKQTFTPTKDPQKSIQVKIGVKGTGNWTLTVHDAQNRTVTSKTIANADMTDATYVEFTFASVWRPLSGYSYHFHITSTVADGTVVSSGSNDLETCEFYTYYQYLISDTYHPMMQMLNFLAIGNERYVGTLEPGSLYYPNKIKLPSGYHTRCFGYWREYLAIGCYRGSAISDYQEGMIFFWDGIADTYNFLITVPEGGVNAMYGTRDLLFIVAGNQGDILVYTGSGNAEKLEKIPGIDTGETIEVSPGAINMYQTLICIGGALSCDATSNYKGIYTYGTLNKNYPYSLGFDHETSLGEQISNNVKIGLVYPAGGDLYVGWQNSNAYGIDKITQTNNCYQTGSLEQLIVDADELFKDKINLTLRADFSALEANQKIRLKYKLDRASSWTYNDWEDTDGATYSRMRIINRSKEIEIGVDFYSDSGSSIELYGLGLQLETSDERSI